MGIFKLLGATAALAGLASAQFVPPPTDLTKVMGHAGVPVRYKQVPAGTCEMNPAVKSYSGYADVAQDEHIFFWFFEARTVDPTAAPLTVWINGGPGSSSMIGLFQELGPCTVDHLGNVQDNPFSWSTASNMLFIDQPTQTGFSYSVPVPAYAGDDGQLVELAPNASCPANTTSCGTWSRPDLSLTANSTGAAAPNFWKTLQGFMGAFPQYSRTSFHFATESYGGHYGPVFNAYIEERNAALRCGEKAINLETVLIGNGWHDPTVAYGAYYNFSVSPGNTYDITLTPPQQSAMFDAMYGAGNCSDQLAACAVAPAATSDQVCSDADNFCYQYVELAFDDATGRDEYDARELTPDPFPYSFYEAYLNTPALQQAIGAFTNWSASSPTVGRDFGLTGDDGREVGLTAATRSLLASNVSVALYAGDADYICNWLGVEAFATAVGSPAYLSAGYANLSISDGVPHGQVKQAGKLSFTRFYEAGHEVPFYQPLASLEFFARAIRGLDLATGTKAVGDGYATEGPASSLWYREGNATVQYEVLPPDAVYNVNTNEPDGTWPGGVAAQSKKTGAKKNERARPKWWA